MSLLGALIARLFGLLPTPALIVIGAVAAPVAATVAATAGAPQAGPAADLLRFEGSNTVGDKLGPDLFKAWAHKRRLDAIKVIEGQPDESEIVASGSESSRQLRATVHAHGTGTGLDPLIPGTADIWMASRQATAAEIAKSRQAGFGNMLDPANEHTIALDALLVIVHRDNPVQQLTVDQIADIFTGKTTNWAQVGGRDAPISVYSRDADSGTFDTFNTLEQHPTERNRSVG